MNRRWYWGCIISVLLAVVLPAIILAQSDDTPHLPPVVLTDSQGQYPLGRHLEILQDSTAQLTIEDVASSAYDEQFTPSQADTPNSGYTTGAVWVRLRVRNQANPATTWRLGVEEARLGYVDLYTPAPNGTGFARQQAGRFRPATVQAVPYRYGVFNLSLPPDQAQTMYLRVQSASPVRLPLTLWSLDAFAHHAQTDVLILGLFFGAILVMMGYSFFLFASLRDRNHLYLTLFIASFGFALAFGGGLAHQYLWPAWPDWYGVEITTGVATISMLLFAMNFLDTKTQTPWLHTIMLALLPTALFVLILRFFGESNRLLNLTFLVITLITIAAGYLAWWRGYRPARYFLLAWLLFLGTLAINFLANFGLLFHNPFGPYGLQIGMVLMMLLLSLALADRINLLSVETAQSNEALQKEIQDRKNAQFALSESEKKYRAVVEQAAEGIMVVQDYQRTYYNPAFLDIIGYSAEAYNAMPMLALVHPDDLDRVEQAYQQLLTGQTFDTPFEFKIISKSGDTKWLAIRGTTIEWEGKSAGMVLVQDTTRRKQLEIQLRQHRDDLEEQVARRTHELAGFIDLSMLITEPGPLTDVLKVALARIIELEKCQAVALHLVTEEQEALSLMAQRGLSLAQQEQLQQLPLTPTLSDWLGQHQEAVPAIDPAGTARLSPQLWLDGFQVYLGVQIRAREQVQGILSYYQVNAKPFSMNEILLLAALGEILGIIIENHRLRSHIEEIAIVSERHRLARDLHDSITQSLYSINLFVHAVRQSAEMSDAERLNNSLNRVEAISHTALKEMRLLLYQLRPPLLTEKSLAEVLQLRFDSVEGRLGIEVEYQVEGSFDLPPDIAEDMYRVAIETLNNSLKHAEASRVSVQLVMTAPTVTLKIVDNGRGFDPNYVNGGMGLPNIRERLARWGGNLTIESAPGAGTSTTITINVPHEPVNGRHEKANLPQKDKQL